MFKCPFEQMVEDSYRDWYVIEHLRKLTDERKRQWPHLGDRSRYASTRMWHVHMAGVGLPANWKHQALK